MEEVAVMREKFGSQSAQLDRMLPKMGDPIGFRV